MPKVDWAQELFSLIKAVFFCQPTEFFCHNKLVNSNFSYNLRSSEHAQLGIVWGDRSWSEEIGPQERATQHHSVPARIHVEQPPPPTEQRRRSHQNENVRKGVIKSRCGTEGSRSQPWRWPFCWNNISTCPASILYPLAVAGYVQRQILLACLCLAILSICLVFV